MPQRPWDEVEKNLGGRLALCRGVARSRVEGGSPHPSETVTDSQLVRLLEVEQARALARDLVRTLAEHVADPAGVDAVMRAHVAEHGPFDASLVVLAALRLTFAECLTYADPVDVPPGAVTFRTDERTHP